MRVSSDCSGRLLRDSLRTVTGPPVGLHIAGRFSGYRDSASFNIRLIELFVSCCDIITTGVQLFT